MKNGINREYGSHRCSMGGSRAAFRPKRREDGRWRPWQDTRAVLNGVFLVLRTGAPWHDLPRRCRPYQICHRRFQQWQSSGLLTPMRQKLAEDLRGRGKMDLSESFLDASFSSAKKGALLSALLGAAKAAKSWRSATAVVFLSRCTWPALHLMKQSWSEPPSSNASWPKFPGA
jgi:transposase